MFCECGCGQETPIADKTDLRWGYVKGQPRPLIAYHKRPGHEARAESPTPRDITEDNIGDNHTLPVSDEWLKAQGLDIPTGENRWVYATVEQRSHADRRHWLRVVPSTYNGPEWPVVQPAAPVVIKQRLFIPRKLNGRRTVILPDPQIGFLRLADGTMIPIHDEEAMAVALGVIEAVRPHVILNLGDYLDLAEWSSKFAVFPEFVFTTQPAVDAGHQFLAEQISAAGPTLERTILLEGNHDDRIPRLISQNARAAMRLRRADSTDNWPVMSVPNLLCLDDLGVEYVDGYPAGRVKVAEAHGRQTPLYALHGERLDMAKQAKAEGQSTVQGHAHHVAVHSETYEYDGMAREVEAWSLGCLCKVNGAVPSTRGGTKVSGRPVERHESWQQAVGVLTETDDGWDLEPVRIRNGRAMFRGELIVAREDAA